MVTIAFRLRVGCEDDGKGTVERNHEPALGVKVLCIDRPHRRHTHSVQPKLGELLALKPALQAPVALSETPPIAWETIYWIDLPSVLGNQLPRLLEGRGGTTGLPGLLRRKQAAKVNDWRDDRCGGRFHSP